LGLSAEIEKSYTRQNNTSAEGLCTLRYRDRVRPYATRRNCNEVSGEQHDGELRIKAEQRECRAKSALGMSFSAPILLDGPVLAGTMSRRDRIVLCLIATLHLVALIIMAETEADLVDKAAFLLVWGMLNFFWLALVRRPAVAAILSLEFVIALTLLSRFKYDKLWMTVDFVDFMIIDRDTSAFLLAAFPSLRGWIGLAAAVTTVLLIAAWRF
jgi:hypothetical protein